MLDLVMEYMVRYLPFVMPFGLLWLFIMDCRKNNPRVVWTIFAFVGSVFLAVAWYMDGMYKPSW